MNRSIALMLLVFAGFWWASPALADDDTGKSLAARLEAAIKSEAVDNQYMGTALVARGGKIILDRGYGQADLGWDLPNAPDVKFRIGSLTKQFTAALILMLQEEHKLDISDPVRKYLPDAPAAWDGITLAQLLGHVSGIPNFTDDERFGVWAMAPRTLAEEMAFITGKPLNFAPGAKYEYSNSNYEVLGAVIEKVTGKPYVEMLQQRILTPLAMKDSGLDTDTLILPKHAAGYTLDGKQLKAARSESLTVPWAAGSMYSTTHDLLRWEQGLFGGKVLSPASLKLMLTPGKGDYGLGVHVKAGDGITTVDHSGGIEGFTTYLAYQPESRTAVIVLANIDNGAPPKIGKRLLEILKVAEKAK